MADCVYRQWFLDLFLGPFSNVNDRIMQCRLRAWRPRASNEGLRPCPLHTQISPVSMNLLMMLCTLCDLQNLCNLTLRNVVFKVFQVHWTLIQHSLLVLCQVVWPLQHTVGFLPWTGKYLTSQTCLHIILFLASHLHQLELQQDWHHACHIFKNGFNVMLLMKKNTVLLLVLDNRDT